VRFVCLQCIHEHGHALSNSTFGSFWSLDRLGICFDKDGSYRTGVWDLNSSPRGRSEMALRGKLVRRGQCEIDLEVISGFGK